MLLRDCGRGGGEVSVESRRGKGKDTEEEYDTYVHMKTS
jgi:hypothetical protein